MSLAESRLTLIHELREQIEDLNRIATYAVHFHERTEAKVTLRLFERAVDEIIRLERIKGEDFFARSASYGPNFEKIKTRKDLGNEISEEKE